ncbi:unnamed protein product [Closterium sp. NIES-53]
MPPPYPPPHSGTCGSERERRRCGSWVLTPATPNPKEERRVAEAARASAARVHGRLLRVRVPQRVLAADARAHAAARAFASATVRTAVRTAAARAGDCYARRRARCCSARLCVLRDGARDGLRTAGVFATVDGVFATVDGAFATGRTRDEGMTEVWWAQYRKVRRNLLSNLYML